jgi:hypothetical protein
MGILLFRRGGLHALGSHALSLGRFIPGLPDHDELDIGGVWRSTVTSRALFQCDQFADYPITVAQSSWRSIGDWLARESNFMVRRSKAKTPGAFWRRGFSGVTA